MRFEGQRSVSDRCSTSHSNRSYSELEEPALPVPAKSSMSAAALLSSKWEDLLKTMKRVSKYKWYRIFITQNWCDFRCIYIYCELTSILANHFNSHFTSIQMVYNQALLNNLYHIKKYKDIKVLVQGGKEAQTYEFIMSVHGIKRRFTVSVCYLNHEHYAFYDHL